jgi:hypothetical protein
MDSLPQMPRLVRANQVRRPSRTPPRSLGSDGPLPLRLGLRDRRLLDPRVAASADRLEIGEQIEAAQAPRNLVMSDQIVARAAVLALRADGDHGGQNRPWQVSPGSPYRHPANSSKPGRQSRDLVMGRGGLEPPTYGL